MAVRGGWRPLEIILKCVYLLFMVREKGNLVREKSGNFEMEPLRQPCYCYVVTSLVRLA